MAGFRCLMGFIVIVAQDSFFDATGFTVIFRIAQMRGYAILLVMIQLLK